MLRMAQVNNIKDLYENEDLSLREISRKTGHSFKTVQKYAYQLDWSEDNLPDTEPTSYPVLGDFIPVIDEWLEADRKIPRKQRHTVWRIFCRLRDEHGFGGSYSSVKKYVRKKRFVMNSKNSGYLPLEHTLGSGQVDFGKHLYYDGAGQEQDGYALTISFPNSNKGYTQTFPSQNQECLLTGMKRIFEHIGGVPPVLRFDNMSTAVVQVLKGTDRILTDGFTRFMMHYRFRAEFCNPASGNEKGNVENKVGYSRRNAFVPVPTIISFDDFNESLWDWCEKDAQRPHYKKKLLIEELWEDDKASLLCLPEYPFSVFRYSALTVNKNGFVTIETNKYGLSPALAGETVQAKIFFDHVEFFHDHHPVGHFRRSYKTNDEVFDWTQYVSVLCKKPGAIEHTRFFHQILVSTLAIGAGLLCARSVQLINQRFGMFPRLIQKARVCGILDLRWCAGGIHNHGAAVPAIIIIIGVLFRAFLCAHNHLIDFPQYLRCQTLAKIHHQGRVEGRLTVIV